MWELREWFKNMTNLKFLEFSGHFDRFSLAWAQKRRKKKTPPRPPPPVHHRDFGWCQGHFSTPQTHTTNFYEHPYPPSTQLPPQKKTSSTLMPPHLTTPPILVFTVVFIHPPPLHDVAISNQYNHPAIAIRSKNPRCNLWASEGMEMEIFVPFWKCAISLPLFFLVYHGVSTEMQPKTRWETKILRNQTMEGLLFWF